MAIEMSGGVYCPLSPRDPEYRLHALLQQTQSRVVLVHWLTKTKFQNNAIVVDIDKQLINNNVGDDDESDANIDLLSDGMMIPDNIAYIIFTSGSTGIPKAVGSESFE
jgi:non-ribosomal peptide synthetase component F